MKTKEAPHTVIEAECRRFLQMQDSTPDKVAEVKAAKKALEDAEGRLRFHLRSMSDIVGFLKDQEADDDGDYQEWHKETLDLVKESGIEIKNGE